jgi:hypothetical protein
MQSWAFITPADAIGSSPFAVRKPGYRPGVFRGFAPADDLAPFIVINDNDPAHSFTLLHELVHISGSA